MGVGWRGRGRGRGRGKFKDQDPDHLISSAAGSSERVKIRLKDRVRAKYARAAQPPPSLENVIVPDALPKFVFGIAHEGEVTWDAKWRPVAEVDDNTCLADVVDERESLRLGYLAAILGDGSVQV